MDELSAEKKLVEGNELKCELCDCDLSKRGHYTVRLPKFGIAFTCCEKCAQECFNLYRVS